MARLMLLDTASLYFRAFHGIPDTIAAAHGTPVNAVRGLLDMIARLVAEFEATHLVACWDDDWRPAWRVGLIPGYKAHRVAEPVPGGVDVEETPPGLVAQIPLIRRMLVAIGIPVVGAASAEADDVIGTLANDAGMPVDIVTGDRDLFQLVDDAEEVRVVYTARGMSRLELVTDAIVESKYGVSPRQYADFAVLRGDASDGLPGVSGIGEKTAAALLGEYRTLDGLRAAAADPTSPMSASMRARLVAAGAYLDVAPRVVGVVRDLDLGPVQAALHPVSGERLAEVERLAERWNLGGSTDRVVTALAAAASVEPGDDR